MRLREVAYSVHNCPPAVAAYGDDFQLEFDEGEMARKDWGVSRKATFNGAVCFCKTLDLAAMPKASLRALVGRASPPIALRCWKRLQDMLCGSPLTASGAGRRPRQRRPSSWAARARTCTCPA